MIILVAFITPIVIAMSITILYVVKTKKRTANLRKTIFVTSLINLVTFIIGSLALLLVERDGFGQVIGLGIYLECFLIIEVLNITILLVLEKYNSGTFNR